MEQTSTGLSKATKEKESLNKMMKKETELSKLKEKIGDVQTRCLKLEIEAKVKQKVLCVTNINNSTTLP